MNQLQPLFITGLVFCNGEAYQTRLDQSSRLHNALYRTHNLPSFGMSGTGNRRWFVLTETLPRGEERPRAEEFAAEKIALLKHMARIERETGCKLQK